MSKLFPTLRYRDPKAAIEWLEQAFQFRRHFVAEDGGQIVHAQMRLVGDMIMLGPDHQYDKYGMHSPLALNGTNQCVYVALDSDIDEAADRAQSAGATIVTAPYDTPYGSREFSCKDLEGHVWSFGTYAGEPFA